MAPNSVTPDPKDKIFVLETTGKADIDKIYEEMRAEDTGLRLETIVHSVTLFQQDCSMPCPACWDWQKTADGIRKATVSMSLSRKTK